LRIATAAGASTRDDAGDLEVRLDARARRRWAAAGAVQAGPRIVLIADAVAVEVAGQGAVEPGRVVRAQAGPLDRSGAGAAEGAGAGATAPAAEHADHATDDIEERAARVTRRRPLVDVVAW